MKKLPYTLAAALLFLFAGAPRAQADTYVATVTCGFSVCPYGHAPQVADVSFPAPTTLEVTITSDTEPPAVFEVNLSGKDLVSDAYTWDFLTLGGPTTGWTGVLDINDSYTGVTDIATNGAVPFFDGTAFGSLTFSAASAASPEPGTLVLMIAGAGAMFLLTRKRSSTPLPRT